MQDAIRGEDPELQSEELLKRILADKEERRKRLARLPIEETWRILKIMQGWARGANKG